MRLEPVGAGEVTLRPWLPDAAELYLDLRDEEVFRFTAEDPAWDVESCRRALHAAVDDPSLARFAVCAPSETPVGSVTVARSGRRASISYWLAAHGRGRGLAAAALRAATEWAFETMPVDHAELEIDPANLASIRVAEAAGYHRHGLRLVSVCGGPAQIYRYIPESTP